MTPFPLPIMFTSWAYRDGSGAGEMIRKARLMGAASIAVQLEEPELTADEVKALQDAHFFVVGWGVANDGTYQRISALKVDGWCPQIEGDSQFESAVANWAASVSRPKAIVTTYGGINTGDPAKTAARISKLKAVGLDSALIECYAADDAVGQAIHRDVTRMMWQGTQYGLDATKMFPVVGTWNGEIPSTYLGLDRCGRDWGIYIAEMTGDAQLSQFGVLNPPAPPIPNPATINAQIVALCDTWLSRQVGQQTKSRLRNIRRIAASSGNDTAWLTAQSKVTEGLDLAGL